MTIQLTRKQMTSLLYSLKGQLNQPPSSILEKAFGESNLVTKINDQTIPRFLLKNKRLLNKEYGLSTNEIVSLANLCELTSLKSTSIQNWIKRDIKELIGAPELGKKYSIEQTAMLLIVKDLKSTFEFEKIRNILIIVFNTLSDRSDDLINPIKFYEIYAIVLDSFDTLPFLSDQTLENCIISRIESLPKFKSLSLDQSKPIKNVLVITVLSVLASHMQARSHFYLDNHFVSP